MSHQPTRYADTLIFPASLDPDAVTVVSRLNDAGLESYFVGGCVRDLLVGLLPKDFDVSTAARPRQIRRLFRNSRIIGRRFKLAHVHFGQNVIEVATFRKTPDPSTDADGDEADLLILRDNVFGTAEQDAVRRDFTINALLYDLRTNEVIDYVGGVEDLRQRVLRTIGDPSVRFAEDPVRMLRAVKFMSRLGMHASPETDAAMHECAGLIERSAPPRVLEEIYKLMTCGKAERALALFQEYALLDRLLPEIAPTWRKHPDRFAATGAALDRIDRGQRKLDNSFMLACLFFPTWHERLSDQQGHDAVSVIRDLIAPVAIRMSMPRRDVALLKQILHAFFRFERPPRSRRFRMAEFLSRSTTRRALDLLYVAARAGFVDPELHAEWAQRAANSDTDPESADQAEPADGEEPMTGPRKRRRRSGRRRSRSRGSSDSAVETTDSDAEGMAESADTGDAAGDDAPSEKRGEASTRRRSGRRGRRGGRRRRVAREGNATDEGSEENQPTQPESDATSADSGDGADPKTTSSTRRRRSSQGTRKVAATEKRSARPVRQRHSSASKADSDSDVGPGQRHPEDVEDIFDW
jgi:poly(A) polymerase